MKLSAIKRIQVNGRPVLFQNGVKGGWWWLAIRGRKDWQRDKAPTLKEARRVAILFLRLRDDNED